MVIQINCDVHLKEEISLIGQAVWPNTLEQSISLSISASISEVILAFGDTLT
jgi:hypothetical protein